MRDLKISFCTVSMDRCHHIRKTLLQNLVDNQSYQQLEFILLDYSSKDGLEEYVKHNFQQFIELGRLIYFRTSEAIYFKRAHSRNMAFRLANGDILCNVDADNYTGKDFATYINTAFRKHQELFISSFGSSTNTSDTYGRLCVHRNDFYDTSGYDEQMNNYGFEDFDFAQRLQMLGLKKKRINEEQYLKSIAHTEQERISNEYHFKAIDSIYILHLTPSSSDLIFFFSNQIYKRGTLIDTRDIESDGSHFLPEIPSPKHQFSILQDEWTIGAWKKQANNICLRAQNSHDLFFEVSGHNQIISKDIHKSVYIRIDDPLLKNETIMLLSQITNRLKMDQNRIRNNIKPNGGSFGQGVAFKNFNYQESIHLL